MPLLDVSITLLLDPDLTEAYMVMRRREIVNDNGISFTHISLLKGMVGAITPAGDNSLVRLEAYERGGRAIQVITNFPLRAASKDSGESFQPDVVVYQNDTYVVKNIEDYSRYGAGFVAADCTSMNLINQAEMTTLLTETSIIVPRSS